MREAIIFALFVLAACGKYDDDPGPGGVTVGEARALDDAAEMIAARRLPPEAIGSAATSPPTAEPKP